MIEVDEQGACDLARTVLDAEGIDAGELGLVFVDPEESRADFEAMWLLFDTLRGTFPTGSCAPNVCLTELSMGMSHDYEVAIECGATQVRVGTAIFGTRK